MNTRNHHVNTHVEAAVDSLADFVGDTTSEPRDSLAKILRDLEGAVTVPTGEKRYVYILTWKLPENFFKGRLDRIWAYDGFQEKVKNHDIAGLWNDIAEHVKGTKKSAWRMLFCHILFAALLETREQAEPRMAA
ncbi:hypothetical protein [Rhizobium leguminosarum]|uniref:hypothetical protein n=1 Tax=Rhizobium leguminosarum TaxID=384 RepID=UPI000DE45F77|nr:hypothetical protein [Rhizobium leguminosarum]TBZ97433.1 hypothetical protein E0H63_29500 [Rhizobium leguminosarum bv. viciae]